MYIAVLGSHPRLSLAELARAHSDVSAHNDATAVFEGAYATGLGGSSKVAEVIDEIPITDTPGIESHLLEHMASYMDGRTGKLPFGISIYGGTWPRYKDLCLRVKKRLRNEGFKPRAVFDRGQTLNSAQVLYNRLDEYASEILVSIGRERTYIARTVWVQDVDALSKRDMQRPCRDMETGMLPPKLARIMVNLTGGSYVFDPFCGSGVVLQEALLTGKRAAGSDVNPDMIECTRSNLAWLEREFAAESAQSLEASDVRTVTVPADVDAVTGEMYLGPIMTREAPRSRLDQLADEADTLLGETLQRLQFQLPAGTPVCLAVPSWESHGRSITPALAASGENPRAIDDLRSLGYNHVDMLGVDHGDLHYRRQDQYVGRQLMLLERI